LRGEKRRKSDEKGALTETRVGVRSILASQHTCYLLIANEELKPHEPLLGRCWMLDIIYVRKWFPLEKHWPQSPVFF
jgi:hypothetical protein